MDTKIDDYHEGTNGSTGLIFCFGICNSSSIDSGTRLEQDMTEAVSALAPAKSGTCHQKSTEKCGYLAGAICIWGVLFRREDCISCY